MSKSNISHFFLRISWSNVGLVLRHGELHKLGISFRVKHDLGKYYRGNAVMCKCTVILFNICVIFCHHLQNLLLWCSLLSNTTSRVIHVKKAGKGCWEQQQLNVISEIQWYCRAEGNRCFPVQYEVNFIWSRLLQYIDSTSDFVTLIFFPSSASTLNSN